MHVVLLIYYSISWEYVLFMIMFNHNSNSKSVCLPNMYVIIQNIILNVGA